MSDPGDQLKRELGDDQDAMDIDDAPSSADTLAPLKSEPKPKDDLEHMFDDEDDDDMEAEVERNGWTSKNNVVSDTLEQGKVDEHVMLEFYRRFFPWRHLFRWLNHSEKPTNDFGHREFAFTLRNDKYQRYQAYPTFEALRKDVLRQNPTRFEIGPVYNANPRDRKSMRKGAFKPLAKEFVIDIDLTDYDEIRTCCSKTNICIKCWQFVVMGIKILDPALRDDFGFKHIVWVYSGRRGVHAWVCDKKARKLEDSRRRAIASYLGVLSGGKQGGKKVNLERPLHPHVRRSYELVKLDFKPNILKNQDPFKTSEGAEALLKLLPDRELNEVLRSKWDSQFDRPSVDKWRDVTDADNVKKSTTLNSKTLLERQEDIVLEYTYPRLDAAVSKTLNHLLKSPFVIHPSTGKVCVPIDHRKIDSFRPDDVPTIYQLLKEIDDWKNPAKEEEDAKPISDIDKTSLKPYVDFFAGFVTRLLADEKEDVVKKEGLDY